MRECFARCLGEFCNTHQVVPISSIDEWPEPDDIGVVDAIVIVINGQPSSGKTQLQFLAQAAELAPVVVVSDQDGVGWVQDIIRAGARGFIPASLPFGVLVEAVRLVLAGGTYVPVDMFSNALSEDPGALPFTGCLTERQSMVVDALCQGMANKQIAFELGMSEHTVKVHLRRIMRRLKARNRTEVALIVRERMSS
jgi:DNA-binding NarL/FixJ family response regulator